MWFSRDWLQSYFNDPLPPTDELVDVIERHAFEVEDTAAFGADEVFDADILPNRAHDALCHRGMARELKVLLERDLLEREPDAARAVSTKLTIANNTPERCRRYSGRIIRTLAVSESPAWLKQRLEAIGQRPINNIVDSLNYVMFDMGQPMHAFDVSKMAGGITVRLAQDGEIITTLTGDEVELTGDDLVIADDERALAIAGVKGGAHAEVGMQTTDVVLEAANFVGTGVRKTTSRTGLKTDSSKRFENEVTQSWTLEALERATAMILDLAGTDATTVEEAVDVVAAPEEERSVSVSPEAANTLLGTKLESSDVAALLDRFGFSYEQNDDEFQVTIPRERLDLGGAHDLVEELGRIHGYGSIKPTVPQKDGTPSINKEFYYITTIRHALRDLGFSEVYTSSFVSSGEGVRPVLNPVAEGKEELRTALAPKIREVLEFNLTYADLLACDAVAAFEIGTVFSEDGEHLSLCIGYKKKNKDRKEEWKKKLTQARDAVADVVGVTLDGEPAEYAIEIPLSEIIDDAREPESYGDLNLGSETITSYTPVSPYPFALRDVAVWTPEGTEREEVVGTIKRHAGDLLVTEPICFDIFTKEFESGETKTSYAHRLVFQAPDRTLSDDEVNEIMDTIYDEMKRKKGWEIR